MANAKPPQKRDLNAVVEDARALATVLAAYAESVLGKRAARVLGVVALFAVVVALLLVLLNWFISPDTAQERQGLALVLAIGLGGGAAIVGLYFTRLTLINTRDQEAGRAREAALRACLEQLGSLLTHDKWSATDKKGDTDNHLRALVRAEVLSVLGTLDGGRKRILVRFLYESELLKRGKPAVGFSGADLREAELSGLTLSNASLSYVRLQGAKLGHANLERADLSYSVLYGADLQEAYLLGANLQEANLQGAILPGANLQQANLRRANLEEANLQRANLQAANLEGALVTDEQLADTRFLKAATMPDGSKHT
jgi:uncharacterized protein YjbI with pentapeptide repeats